MISATTAGVMGSTFGDPADPLLLSVRSGARQSMPGMMETVLNVGLCSATIPGMMIEVGQPISHRIDHMLSGTRAAIALNIFAPDQAAECLPILGDLGHITLIGHSHLCKVFGLRPGEVEELPPEDFVLEDGTKYIVSVGSVGQPRDYDNRASYTVYDSDSKSFEFKRIEYDIEGAASKIFDAKLERNFGQRLFIGV